MEPMLRRFGDAGRFLDALRPVWEAREAELNLMVGVACSIRDGWRPSEEPLFGILEEGGEPQAAVLATGHGFIVAEAAEGGAAALARALAGDHAAPMVVASRAAARAFAAAWTEATGDQTAREMAQRIYALEAVTPPRPTRGRLREATIEDADRFGAWLHAFALEATPHEPSELDGCVASARDRIERGRLFGWETEEGVVSMAALARPTPHGVTLSSVYTPPERRGRGYASACVAALSQRALDSGKRFCCLYTDASNPTSNAIYQRLGYREVCESEQWRLAR